MDRNRPLDRLTAIVLAALALPIILLAAYLGSYFACGTEEKAVGYSRTVHFRWMTTFYVPAARVESAVTGEPIDVRYDGSLIRFRDVTEDEAE